MGGADDTAEGDALALPLISELSIRNFSKESAKGLRSGVPAPALFGITKLGIGGGTGLFLSVVMEDDEEEDSFSGGGKTRVCEDEEEHGVLIAGVSPEPDCEGASLELYFREGGKESLGDLELPLAESGGRNIDAIAVPFDL